MKKTVKSSSSRSRSGNTKRETYLMRVLVKQLDELIAAHREQQREVQLLKEEIEGLRRDFSITMESIADLPFVSGMIH
jgi:hypothetical protein